MRACVLYMRVCACSRGLNPLFVHIVQERLLHGGPGEVTPCSTWWGMGAVNKLHMVDTITHYPSKLCGLRPWAPPTWSWAVLLKDWSLPASCGGTKHCTIWGHLPVTCVVDHLIGPGSRRGRIRERGDGRCWKAQVVLPPTNTKERETLTCSLAMLCARTSIYSTW